MVIVIVLYRLRSHNVYVVSFYLNFVRCAQLCFYATGSEFINI